MGSGYRLAVECTSCHFACPSSLLVSLLLPAAVAAANFPYCVMYSPHETFTQNLAQYAKQHGCKHTVVNTVPCGGDLAYGKGSTPAASQKKSLSTASKVTQVVTRLNINF